MMLINPFHADHEENHREGGGGVEEGGNGLQQEEQEEEEVDDNEEFTGMFGKNFLDKLYLKLRDGMRQGAGTGAVGQSGDENFIYNLKFKFI